MNDKKNIDRLFQEKFKNFEVTPDESVWKKIKARQENSRKRAIILPFWYRAAGVAASIILILSIGYVSYNEYLTEEEKIVINSKDTENLIESKTTPDKTFEIKAPSKDIMIATEEEEEETNNPVEESQNTNQDHEAGQSNYYAPPAKKDNAIVIIPKEELSQSKSSLKDQNFTSPTTRISKQEQIAGNILPKDKDNTLSNTATKDKEDIIAKNNIVDNTTISGVSNNDLDSQKQNPLFVTPEQHQENKHNTQNIVENNHENSSPLIDRASEKDENDPTENIETSEDERKKSIFDAINEKEEAIVEETTSTKKWNISPNVAPVYYDVIGDGSSIDPQFSDNSKDGQVNLSYGVQISYSINEKLSIRSGVSKVDLSYNTEDVGFTASARGQNLQSIDYNPNAEAILVSDIGNQNDVITSDFNRAPIQTQNVGLLNQRIDYIEVPMEMKYALVNKKIGVNMIGGISTLFLQDNAISIEAGDFETSVGEANNLNNVSFSGNIGFGVDYKLTDQLQINLEPIFKYQFNAFNGNAENFRPYYFGVYTGVSIKF